MILELHCHTREHSPCSRVSATELAAAVRRRGAGGVVITDHHYLWPAEELAQLKSQCDVPEDFLILAGQEVLTADYGDVLVYGAHSSIHHGMPLATLRNKHPDAALIWAHPYRYGHLPTAVDLTNSDFDAIEVVNPHHTEEENRRAVSDWQRWQYRATSGSDIHRIDFTDFFPVRFDCEITAIEGLMACIKAGRFQAQLGRHLP